MIETLLNFTHRRPERFTVLFEQGPFELRQYQPMVCARVYFSGNFSDSIKMGMDHLGQYLAGNNFKITKIPHHGPYFQIHRANQWELGLILPEEIQLLTAPKPMNRLIRIEEIVSQKVAALKYSGAISPERVIRKGEELKRWLWKNKLRLDGPLKFMRNDLGPNVTFFKTSEVLFDVA